MSVDPLDRLVAAETVDPSAVPPVDSAGNEISRRPRPQRPALQLERCFRTHGKSIERTNVDRLWPSMPWRFRPERNRAMHRAPQRLPPPAARSPHLGQRARNQRTRKRPKELVGGPLVDAHRLRTSPESLRSAQVPRSPALRPSNPVPGTVPRIAPRCGLAVRTCPFGQDEMYWPGPRGHNGLIHELRPNRGRLIPELPPDVDDMWMACSATRVQHPSIIGEA